MAVPIREPQRPRRTVRLAQIAAALGAARWPGDDPLITGIRYDSRSVEPGDLFVAVPGAHTDGHAHVADALRRGAAAVLVQRDREAIWRADAPPVGAFVVVDDTRAALALAAAVYYGHPARRLRVAGVTGTDGKTTTTHLASAMLEAAGLRTGLLGTVDFKAGERVWSNDSRQTTPEAPEVQALLAEMVDAGVDVAVVESTSHGLALHRLDGCEYDVAALTNITADHLDFHGTRDDYVAAKARLFAMLDEAADKGIGKWAVLNAGDPASAVMRAATAKAAIITYGVGGDAALVARDIEATARGSRFTAHYGGASAPTAVALPGRFNIANGLAALGIGLALGLTLAEAAEGLRQTRGVAGRMERIDEGQPFAVIVDYAHTEPALRQVLGELRAATRGRVILVIGAAGQRDESRREGLGRASAELADRIIVTTEDPREEDEDAIIAAIARAVVAAGRAEGRDFVRIADRGEAIARAVAEARAGDTVLIAGKGHERSIIVGREKRPWDDREAARQALRKASTRA